MSGSKTKVFDAVAIRARHRTNKGHQLQRAFSILLFSVFVVVDLLALVAGTSSYGSITTMQTANDKRIMTLGPITSSVRTNDAEGGVASGNGPEGRSLVLLQKDAEGTYETRIYLYHGAVMQEYALAGSSYTPEKATTLARSNTFSFSYDDDLLTIVTDAGEARIALRNMQGGA